MDLQAFIRKWQRVDLPERAASQEHFLNLCALIGVKTPAELDPTGEVFTFEKSVRVSGPASAGSRGERGFADVWYKDRFGWEYKRKGKYQTLAEAYRQLNQYRDDLGNPPLLIVSDIARTEIHTNFTGFKPDVHVIDLDSLAEPGQLDLLRRAFTDPNSFRPDETPEEVTQKAAVAIGSIAQGLRDRGHDPHDAAHFLMKVMFCLFAEDVELLPKGLFEKMLGKYRHEPERLRAQMTALFAAMRTGGDFGIDEIAYFNGGLFDDADAIELTEGEIAHLVTAASKDWSQVEPSIFGTLFERSLDPAKRAQIGAHYTSRDDIMLVIEPVILRPLRREWDETQAKIATQLERRRKATTKPTKDKADREIADCFDGFQQRLAAVRVLDPACGSGNFLYVAIQCLLDLEREVIVAASEPEFGLGGLFPRVRPTQLLGIEINPYAAELAQVVIWIGYLQWMRDNGFNAPRDPILEPIETIENRDAILAWHDESGKPLPAWRERAVCQGKAEWPEADFIVGNPPFLGSKQLRNSGLSDDYLTSLYDHFDLPNTSDLVCYWFEIAQQRLRNAHHSRVGLLATQGIRGRDNRRALERLAEHGIIFDAWADREWVLDGAAVHVSIICFAQAEPDGCHLDGARVPAINPDLSSGISLGEATTLPENGPPLWTVGTQKGGSFDFTTHTAGELLATPTTSNESQLEVVRPWLSGMDISRRRRGKWCVYFNPEREIGWAAAFDGPFSHVEQLVKPERANNRRASYREYWWIHQEPRAGMDTRLRARPRYIATPMVTKYRLFTFLASPSIPDKQLTVFARSDDYFFGVLHSAVHELWARRQGTQLREAESGFRYTPTTCFETFPLPWPPGSEPAEGEEHRDLHDAIADAAKALDDQRERWLNPPEWVAEIAERVDAADDFADVERVSGAEARRLIRQSAIDAASAKDPRLKKRTLTNLYNERPTWLRLAHEALDRAVLAAYAAIDPEGDWDPAWAEVFVETGAGQPLPEGDGGTPHPLAERRGEVEQSILAALLRLNQARAG
ncbi:MAG: hypothetical protein RIB60_11245 [Phycisphaerales bacterium]